VDARSAIVGPLFHAVAGDHVCCFRQNCFLQNSGPKLRVTGDLNYAMSSMVCVESDSAFRMLLNQHRR
jgi:hypothetical protein